MDRFRIQVGHGGHHVPKDKIIEWYGRSLRNLLPAMGLCHHAFLFDNSKAFRDEVSEPRLLAGTKRTRGARIGHGTLVHA